ncbi:MAG: lamin tail domain-containing protein [bacterium]
MNKMRRILFFSTLFFAGIFCFNVNNVLAAGKVNINTANVEELKTLSGIGDVKAQAIIDYRNLNSPFMAIEDIMNVSGIKTNIFDKIKDSITVGGVESSFCGDGRMDGVEECDDGNNTNGDGCENDCKILSLPSYSSNSRQNFSNRFQGSVVINELVSDPQDGPEWIELYNKTGGEIDLNGWRIEEGSESETVLENKISGYGYLTIENPKGNLNNKGDVVFLFDNFGNVIDQVVYGNWDNGNVDDNAPKSSDPKGIGRVGASQDTNNDLADFAVVSVLTPDAANIFIEEKLKDEIKESILKNKIIINEIFPNPKGDDSGEFIEFKNIGDSEVDLSGFLVGDNSKRRYKIKDDVKIKFGEFFVVSRIDSKIALNNTGGDRVVLYDAQGNVVDDVEYKEKALEDKSYILLQKTSDTQGGVGRLQSKSFWEWTDEPTVGAENTLVKENQPPVAVIDFDKSDVLVGEEFILDCSDSYDPEGEDLILEWQADGLLFHDRILKLKFDEVGNYEIKLTLSDGEKKTVETRLVNVAGRAGSCGGSSASSAEAELPPIPLINEFLPNPVGSDDAEFVELFNAGDVEINLKNFYLDDGDGGSSPYHIIDDVILKPFGYFVFERGLTKLALNNTSDAVRLLDENKNVLERVDYSGVAEGVSFSRAFDGNWFWTRGITKGFENQIIFADEFGSSVGGVELGFGEVELDQARGMEIGESVKTRGIVSVLPGVLGSQVFYISGVAVGGALNPPPTPPNPPLRKGGISCGGIQVYSYKKDFPELSIGDEVEVIGVLSQSGGEDRLKISQKDDIKILGNVGYVPPLKITTDEIGKEIEGGFVLVEGEIVEITGSSIFIDDGSGEVKIYLKESSGVKKSDLKEGDVVSVAGIVSQTSSGFRLLPRSQDDIKKVDVLGVEFAEGAVGENSSEIIIEPRNSDWLKYVTAGLGAVVLILGVVVLRMRKGD